LFQEKKMIKQKVAHAIGILGVCTLGSMASEIELESITVETKAGSEVIKDVSGEELKSADLAEALAKQSASVTLVRRSGISNDIIIRGLKKDNINVTIDGAKAYGAGPNRMDPPISHVLTNNIDYITLNEGPYNVEDFGVLGADVKIHTKEPSQELSGEASVNVGSFGYKKGTLSISGGTETVRALLSVSKETGEQYKDGNGNTFAEQQDIYVQTHPTSAKFSYLPEQRDRDAFSKNTLFSKLYWHINETQDLSVSYTRNRSSNILYPNTAMDAIAVDDDIYNVQYTIRDLGQYSKKLTLSAYYSDVYHPMSNIFRKVSAVNYISHTLNDVTKGAKIKNEFDLSNHKISLGIDYSNRHWDGGFYKDDTPLPPASFHSIWDADTDNIGLFMEDKLTLDNWEIATGLRYDFTNVTTARAGVPSNSYDGLSGNVLATYQASAKSHYFVGLGIASRVPDGKELYFYNKGVEIGTNTLKKVTNTEIDMGAQWQTDSILLKVKLFYSDLGDYIVYNATTQRYVNTDATLYGLDISGTYFTSENTYVDYGISYQRGEKKEALVGQTDKDLAEIPPLKLNLALHYDYDDSLQMDVSAVYGAKWEHFDGDNGEVALDNYTVMNAKVSKTFAKHFELTMGIDNIFNETYALSNTYKDQTLISGGGDVMLMNEPGRYIYTNLKYTF